MSPERTYTLTKLAPGDYVLPSNEGKTLWRISRYIVDDRSSKERWLIQRWLGRGNIETVPREELLDWNLWETWDTGYETRREAIDAAVQWIWPVEEKAAEVREALSEWRSVADCYRQTNSGEDQPNE